MWNLQWPKPGKGLQRKTYKLSQKAHGHTRVNLRKWPYGHPRKPQAERRAGELLQEQTKHKGGRPKENRSTDTTGFSPDTLDDLGITKDQSSQWQKIE